MPITINGDGTVTGISAGGLPDNCITNAELADDAVAIADLAATGTANSSTFLRGDNTWSGAGVLLKRTYYEIDRATCTNSLIPADDTVPQRTEGDEVFSQAYSPTNTSGADIWITTYLHVAETSNVVNGSVLALFISDNLNALRVVSGYVTGGSDRHNVTLHIIHKIPTWSGSKTLSLRVGSAHTVNYQHTGADWAATLYSAEASKTPFIIEEIST